MNILKAHDYIFERIEEYQNLKLAENCKPVAPYFINDRVRKDLRAMVGKGTPEEMVIEAKIWEKLKGVHFNKMTEEEAKEFLINRHIGIDCSGFIVHTLDHWYKKTTGKHIWSKLKIPRKSFFAWLKYKLRPVENLGADVITNDENCTRVELKDVEPIDLVRSKSRKTNSDHIMMVVQVEKNDEGLPTKIIYAHSSPYFGKDNGVRLGEIELTDLSKPLEEQNWLETDNDGNIPTLEGFKINSGDNGLRRLRL